VRSDKVAREAGPIHARPREEIIQTGIRYVFHVPGSPEAMRRTLLCRTPEAAQFIRELAHATDDEW
jgi:hypothetical protein